MRKVKEVIEDDEEVEEKVYYSLVELSDDIEAAVLAKPKDKRSRHYRDFIENYAYLTTMYNKMAKTKIYKTKI